MIRHALLILILTSTSACAGWCDPSLDECWSKPKPQVRAWVRHAKPKVIIKRDVVVVKPIADHRCKPYVAAIGDSAKSEAAAKLEAQKAWKGVVQFEHRTPVPTWIGEVTMKKPTPFRTKIVNVRLKRAPRVSDHALVRYIQRCGSSKDNAILTSYRSEIARHLRTGVLSGASAIVVNGAKIIIEGDVAVTVLDKHQIPKRQSQKHIIEARS